MELDCCMNSASGGKSEGQFDALIVKLGVYRESLEIVNIRHSYFTYNFSLLVIQV